MIESTEVVFKIKVDHKKVRDAYKEYKQKPTESNYMNEQSVLIFESLLRSKFIYVPESQLSRFVQYGKVIE